MNESFRSYPLTDSFFPNSFENMEEKSSENDKTLYKLRSLPVPIPNKTSKNKDIVISPNVPLVNSCNLLKKCLENNFKNNLKQI